MKIIYRILLLCALNAGLVAQTAPTLEQAAAAADSGRRTEAIQMYRAIVQREPENVAALGPLVDLLQASGNSKEAAPVLEQLVKLSPHDAGALYQLGQIKSWQSETRGQALDLLKRACTETQNKEYCTAYGDTLSWRGENREQAVAQLQAVVTAHPEYVPARIKLAQVLSWNTATRPRSLELFEEGLQRDPQNKDLLMASAEVLSWSRTTRAEALARYDRVLLQNPDETHAMTGKAQLLSWQGRAEEALALYRKVLAKDPGNTAALQGAADILTWKGRYKDARVLAQQARNGAPADESVLLTLARANIGLQKYADARDALSYISGTPSPEFDQARQQVRRGLGTYIETGYAMRAEQGELDFHRFDVAISTPVNAANRITFIYQPTLWDARGRGFNSSYFGANLDSEINDNLSTHLQVGADVVANVPVNYDGGASLRYKPSNSTNLRVGFDREPVEESLLSTRGDTNVAGVMFGQLRSNIASLAFGYDNRAHKYDLNLAYTDGLYTGEGLDSNRRYSIEGQIGKELLGQKPYLHIAYGIDYTSFDHDADHQPGQTLTNTTGGYFSPTRFLLNQAIISTAHRFSDKLQWNASGTLGGQNVQTGAGPDTFKTTQFASSFTTNLFWRAASSEELRFGYEYLNVYNAFARNLFRFSWRHYF